MAIQNIFKRYELKYLLTARQYSELTKEIGNNIRRDEYGKSTVCNVYFDTPDKRLIRRSEEKPFYKEKMRLRCYGQLKNGGTLFMELKKKYDSVVYKRREVVNEEAAKKFLETKKPFSQITSEIAYFMNFYNPLSPSFYISYEREAFVGKTENDLRITFDRNILWRETDLSLKSPAYGQKLLCDGEVLMEIKTTESIPVWLASSLGKLKIYKTTFSKYGKAYAASKTKTIKGEIKYA